MSAGKTAEGGTKLQFEATISGVKPVIAKPDQYGGGPKGELQLTLRLMQPETPRPPQKPYPYSQGTRPKKEGDEQARWDAAKLRDEQATAEYEAAMERHAERMAAHAPRLMQYASMVGIATVFGSTPVQVVITPLNQDLMPGFTAVLLPEPAERAAPPAALAGGSYEADEEDDE